MAELNLYEDCGSLKNFVEKYIDEEFGPFLRSEPTTMRTYKDDTAEQVAAAAMIDTWHSLDRFTGYLQIAIADYLEDHDVVEWPRYGYKVGISKRVAVGDRGAEFGQKVNEIIQKRLKDGVQITLPEKVKLPQVPFMDIEREYNDLEFKYREFTKGDTVAGAISIWIIRLVALATLGAVLYYVWIRQYPSALVQWIILICGLVSWPTIGFLIYMRVKGIARTSEYRAEKKEMKRELKAIRNSEEYKIAERRRKEMPQRIEKWKQEMKKAVK